MFHFDPGKHYPKLMESPAIIRFQDCDPLKHLNNAKYFDYYFNAREDQIVHFYGMTSSDFYRRHHATWVIYNHNISYVRWAWVGETVHIFSHIIYYDADTIVTEFFMTDYEKKEIKNLLWTTSKYIDTQTGKRTPHHEEVLRFLEKVHDPVEGFPQLTHHERVKQLKAWLLEQGASQAGKQ